MEINQIKLGMRLRLKDHVTSPRKNRTWLVTQIHPTFIIAKTGHIKRALYAPHLRVWEEVRRVADWECAA